jgi:hypothetical protein
MVEAVLMRLFVLTQNAVTTGRRHHGENGGDDMDITIIGENLKMTLQKRTPVQGRRAEPTEPFQQKKKGHIFTVKCTFSRGV